MALPSLLPPRSPGSQAWALPSSRMPPWEAECRLGADDLCPRAFEPPATVPSALPPNFFPQSDQDLEGQWREGLGWPLLASGGNPPGPKLKGSGREARWGDGGFHGSGRGCRWDPLSLVRPPARPSFPSKCTPTACCVGRRAGCFWVPSSLLPDAAGEASVRLCEQEWPDTGQAGQD